MLKTTRTEAWVRLGKARNRLLETWGEYDLADNNAILREGRAMEIIGEAQREFTIGYYDGVKAKCTQAVAILEGN